MFTLFFSVKTTDKINFVDFFFMVKYSQNSEFIGVSKGSVPYTISLVTPENS